MATLGVQIVGDSTGLKAALGEATAATEKFAGDYKVAFAGMTDSTLRLAVAEDKLAAATARYGSGSQGAAAATLAYRRQVESLRESHLRTAESIGRGLTTYVTAPTALLGFEATKMGVEFQKQMLLIQTQAGASASEVKNLSSQVLDLSGSVGMGPTELAQGLYHLESLGLRGSEAMRTLKISALAAGMGVANLEDVTTALGGAVVTGIKGAENYQTAMATLTATVGAGNMRFQDLAGSIGKVAPAAAAAGVTLPELGAAMATLTDRGFSADEAATRLRMTFALIQSPTAKAQKALKDMGINADELGSMLRKPGGLLKVLETLQAGIQKVGPARGNRDLLQGFGGGRSGLGIQTLVGSLSSSLSSYQQKLEDVSAGEKKYAANQKAYMESPAFKLQQDIANIEKELTKFGQSLIPIAVGASKVIGGIADAFGKLPGPVKAELGAVIGLLAVGGPLILAGTGVLKLIRAIGKAFEILPAEAGPAVAATDAEIASIGASAAESEVAVLSLRSAIGSLAGPAAILGVGIPMLIDAYKNTHNLGKSKGRGGTAGNVLEKGGKYYLVSPQNAARGGPGGMRQIPKAQADALLGRGAPDALSRALGNNTASLFTTPAVPKPAPRKTSSGAGAGSGLSHQEALAELGVAQAGLTTSTADDRRALERQASILKQELAQAKTLKDKTALTNQLGQVLSQINSIDTQNVKTRKKAADAAAKAAKQFGLPLALQEQQARADALAALNPNAGGPTALQKKLAEKAKALAMKAINSHKLTLNQLIDAWNIVGQANQTLAQDTKTTGQKVKLSAEKFTAGLGLTRDQRIAAEQRFAQVQAHNGYMPHGQAALGIVINVDGSKDPAATAREVIKHIQKHQKSAARQTRGRHGGNPLAFKP